MSLPIYKKIIEKDIIENLKIRQIDKAKFYIKKDTKKIAIIGFEYSGYNVFSLNKDLLENYLSILYCDDYIRDIKTKYKYKSSCYFDKIEVWDNGYRRISKEILNYCNKYNPFNEKDINADYYIIFYNYFDLNYCDLIIDIAKKIRENNKTLIGIFSNPFSFEGKHRNKFCRTKLEMAITYFEKVQIYESDELKDIIKVDPPNLIGEIMKNIDIIFAFLIRESIKQIKSNKLDDISIEYIKSKYRT